MNYINGNNAVLACIISITLVGLWAIVTMTGVGEPKFLALERYVDREHESWEVFPDGQILMAGHKRYLAVSREQRNSNDRYFGVKTYGFEIDIPVANKAWKKIICPLAWR